MTITRVGLSGSGHGADWHRLFGSPVFNPHPCLGHDSGPILRRDERRSTDSHEQSASHQR
jgi:hypothetical protein